jgi:ATP-dependent DNA ligase
MPELIQKAVEFDKLAAAMKKKYGNVQALFDAGWWCQPKYDGVHLIVDTAAGQVLTRTGERVISCDHLLEWAGFLGGGGWVFQGEAWMPRQDFHTISGCVRRHAPAPALLLQVYDCHPKDAWDTKRNPATYRQRMYGTPMCDMPIMHETINHSRPLDVERYAAELVARGGYDGAILRDPNSAWEPGLARQGQIVKVKPSVSLDLRVVGWSAKPGAKTGREVVTFTVEYRGARTDVGSGVPHDITPDNAQRYVGQIIEVECMAVNQSGTLREPRYKGWRFDKEEPDR